VTTSWLALGARKTPFDELRANGGRVLFWVYMLRCADGSYYVGHTEELELRISRHQSGELGGYTANRRPVQLVFANDLPTRQEALEGEPQSRAGAGEKRRP